MVDISKEQWIGYSLSITIGLISALLAVRIGLPLPWFLGPMIGNTIAAVSGVPVFGPTFLRPIAVPVLGVMLGSAFLPSVVAQATDWISTLAMVPVFLLLSGTATFAFFRRVGRFDPVTAFFSSMPGGLNEMVIQGGAAGGDMRKIALAHSTRILIVIFLVGLVYSYAAGVSSADSEPPYTEFTDLAPGDGAWLVFCAVLGAPLGVVLRLPAGLMVGPLLVSAVLHIAGVVTIGPPTAVSLAAQFVLGTSVGCRFCGTSPREVVSNLVLGSGAAFIMLLAALVSAVGVLLISQVSLWQAFLAFSPGGMMEMSLLAFAIGQSVAYVSVAHVFRFMVVLFVAPAVFRLVSRRLGIGNAISMNPSAVDETERVRNPQTNERT